MELLSVVVAAELARQALGPDALLLIDNVVRHEAPAPRAAPALVRELLARPLDAADAARLFDATVHPLVRGVQNHSRTRNQDLEAALERYLGELAEAQRALRTVAGVDEAKLLRQLEAGRPSADALPVVGIERAATPFLEATLRFATSIGAEGFPEPRTFASAIGTVVLGSHGNDRHPPDAALIVDPGGDDVYERAPATGGAVSVIVDLGGNDRYRGSDVAVRGLSALVDLAGDDRYEMRGAGLGAAIAGASLLVDFSGDDFYEARHFGQGAAASGIGALVDLEGNDEYRVGAWGQGLGLTLGLGLLWDRAGNDRYVAQGTADPFGRGRLSGAQGAGFGYRTALGGGIGILRDEGGNDSYEAELFAQGSGYYYGLGLLWDEGGDDRYRAVRYAQGNGAHEALGVLRDESGDDRYELAWGVGQGMGLDLAVGVLFDAAGEDRYAARFYAQGTATANGLGLLADGGGADRLRVADRYAWGVAEPLRGLPSVGLLLNDAAKAIFEKVENESGSQGAPAVEAACKPADLEHLDRQDFDALVAAGEALRCALARGERWSEAEALLARDPADPLAPWIAQALPAAPEALREKLRETLWRHPSCGVKASVLSIEQREAAMRSTCWRLQAAALRRGAKAEGASLPSFLRAPRAY